jgi:hypothetical protein
VRLPIIRDAMAGNGNPEPVFHTDKDQILFLVTLPCHSELPGTMSLTKSVSKFLVIIDFMAEAVQGYAEYSVDKVDTVALKKSFTSEFSHGVYLFHIDTPPEDKEFIDKFEKIR